MASPKLVLGGSNCAPEYLWGHKHSQAFIFDMNISVESNKKLFTSTFSVDYPSGYAGPKFPDNRSAIGWWPDSSQYDDFTDKITVKKLINYINYHKKFCAPSDYSNSWFTAFKYPIFLTIISIIEVIWQVSNGRWRQERMLLLMNKLQLMVKR